MQTVNFAYVLRYIYLYYKSFVVVVSPLTSLDERPGQYFERKKTSLRLKVQ